MYHLLVIIALLLLAISVVVLMQLFNAFTIKKQLSKMEDQNAKLLAIADATKTQLDDVNTDVTTLLTKIDDLQKAISATGASQQVIDAFQGVLDQATSLAARVPEDTTPVATPTSGPSAGSGQGTDTTGGASLPTGGATSSVPSTDGTVGTTEQGV